MSVSVERRWLLAGGLAAVAIATFYYSRYSRHSGDGGGWWGWLRGCGARQPPRRRRLTADGGCCAALLLAGLPASGRSALLVRTLLSHPRTLAVPRPVTDAPADVHADPQRRLYEYVTSEQMQTQLQRSRFVEVRERGGFLYGSPVDCPGCESCVDLSGGSEPVPLCILKVDVESLPHVQRRCLGCSGGTGAAAREATPTSRPGCRPLLVYVRVPDRQRHVARLMLRDWLPRQQATARLAAAEQQLKAALVGQSVDEFFDVVIENDDLDAASDELDRIVDAQLEQSSRMFSAKQHLSPPRKPVGRVPPVPRTCTVKPVAQHLG